MDYIKILKDSIKKTLLDLEEYLGPGSCLKGTIISNDGINENIYEMTPFTIFETSFVERMVKNILYEFKDDNQKVGWESNYPNVIKYNKSLWSREKIDLALDFIDNHLFGIAVEVKKFVLKNNGGNYNKIKYDIFKIIGYTTCDKNKVGQFKYVLLFFKLGNKEDYISEIKSICKECNDQNEDKLKDILKPVWTTEGIDFVIEKVKNKYFVLFNGDEEDFFYNNANLGAALLKIDI